MKPSKESKTTRYYVRAVRRAIRLLLWLFVLFVVIMFIIWAAPQIWHFVLG